MLRTGADVSTGKCPHRLGSWNRGLVKANANAAFVFSGQGSQYTGMGRALFLTEPAFRKMLFRMEAHWHTARVEADSLLHSAEADSPPSLVHDVLGYGDKSQRTGLSRSVEGEGAENAQSYIHNTRYAQPALLALELALAHVLQLRGVRPTASWGYQCSVKRSPVPRT